MALAGESAVEVLSQDAQGQYLSAGKDTFSGVPLGIRLADLDGDQDLDAVIAAGFSDTTMPPPDPDAKLLIAEWNGNQFVEVGSYQLDTISRSFDIGHTDLDTNLDIVVGQTGFQQNDLFLFRGDGQLGFTSETLTVPTVPTGVHLTDVNDDTRLDILIPSAAGDLRYAIGNGQGAFPEFGPDKNGRLSLLFGMNAGFAYAELDGDPRMLDDLIYVSPNAPLLWIAANRSESLN